MLNLASDLVHVHCAWRLGPLALSPVSSKSSFSSATKGACRERPLHVAATPSACLDIPGQGPVTCLYRDSLPTNHRLKSNPSCHSDWRTWRCSYRLLNFRPDDWHRAPSAAQPQPNSEMNFLTQSPPRTPEQDRKSIPPDLCGLCVRCVRSMNSDPDFVVAREGFDLPQ